MYENLFTENEKKYTGKIFLNNKCLIYRPERAFINQNEIERMITFAKHINRNAYKKIDTVIDFQKNRFKDKLSYIFLEFICRYILSSGRNLYLLLNDETNIYTEGILFSPLQCLRYANKNSQLNFLKSFDTHISLRHYRRIAYVNDPAIDELPSRFMTDIISFLTNLECNREYAVEIATVISELVDNAIDHGGEDVLLDIDVTSDYLKTHATGRYYGVNIVVMNFSDHLLKTKVENKLKNNKYIDNRLVKVKEAYNNHKPHFNGISYTEDDFYTLASFQNQITGRNEMTTTGGTGLTTLISNLANKSDIYNCYMISGNRILNFISGLLNMNKDQWYGFNIENDFINNIPDKRCFMKSKFYMPGTAYNLNFVLKKENENE